MKNTRFLSIALIVLIVAGVGCTTLHETTDSYDFDNNTSRYRGSTVSDPFYYNNTSPVLVRDRYTGKYFYIYPSNSYSQLNNYGYDRRVYTNNGYYGSRSGYYDNRDRYYRNDSRQTLTEDQRRDQRANDDEARKRILGRKNQ